MALLGEEVVEEWLNRQGYFTIRGIRLGVHEIDILAIRPRNDRTCECRHIEVQISVHPVSYITKVPKALRVGGRAAGSAKRRTTKELTQGVKEWVATKYDHPRKKELRQRLCPGGWTRELVVHQVKHPEELETLAGAEISIIRFDDVVREMSEKKLLIPSSAGNDLFNLMQLGKETPVSTVQE